MNSDRTRDPDYSDRRNSQDQVEVMAARARLKAKQPLLDLQAEEAARRQMGKK